MSPKTSQLQIRVSPEQKRRLQGLAAEAGLSLSAYVLSRAIPGAQSEFDSKAEALRDAAGREEALSDLVACLGSLDDRDFGEALSGTGPRALPPVPANLVAAAVEAEANRRSIAAPAWTRAVTPPARPYFAWSLPSLRLHLMRASPAAFKRRRLFTSFTPAAPHPPGPEGDDTRSLALLDAELQAARVALECCVVGGAVLRLCFSLGTESRRPSALIGHPAVAARAVTAVADQEGLEESWLDAAAREVVQADPTRHYEGVALRVLAPPPDYALAFLCALLRYRPDAATERDVRYLARYLGLSTGGEVARTVDAYLGPRQRPADLDYRVDRWLA